MTTCEAARERIHERLDGPMDAARLAEVEAHLRTCPACREVEEGLALVQRELRALPEVAFPAGALDEVYARTIRSRAARPRRSVWMALAAAAAVLAVALVLRYRTAQQAQPSPQELARAERDARLALGVAAQALRVTQDTTVHRVLGEEVSPILRKIPVRWDKAGESAPIRSRT